MFKKLAVLLLLFLFSRASFSLNDSIFKSLTFGKGKTVIYAGSGALKRYFDLDMFDAAVKNYQKTPALVIGADHCFYPYASNAYLGIGPFVSGWLAQKNFQKENVFIKSRFFNILLAARLTHHHTFFVRKKLDVFTSYIAGVHLNVYQAYVIEGEATDKPKSTFSPAFGMSLTVRYYFSKNIGAYGEGGIGYKINILNVGLCYKLKT